MPHSSCHNGNTRRSVVWLTQLCNSFFQFFLLFLLNSPLVFSFFFSSFSFACSIHRHSNRKQSNSSILLKKSSTLSALWICQREQTHCFTQVNCVILFVYIKFDLSSFSTKISPALECEHQHAHDTASCTAAFHVKFHLKLIWNFHWCNKSWGVKPFSKSLICIFLVNSGSFYSCTKLNCIWKLISWADSHKQQLCPIYCRFEFFSRIYLTPVFVNTPIQIMPDKYFQKPRYLSIWFKITYHMNSLYIICRYSLLG